MERNRNTVATPVMRVLRTWTVAAALLLAGPAHTALAGSVGRSVPAQRDDGGGLPFATADLGWAFLAAVILLALVFVLQLAARRRRRQALRSVARQRTDP